MTLLGKFFAVMILEKEEYSWEVTFIQLSLSYVVDENRKSAAGREMKPGISCGQLAETQTAERAVLTSEKT